VLLRERHQARQAQHRRRRALQPGAAHVLSAKTRCVAKKVVSLSEMARSIPDGASLGLGGSFLHRGPFALVRALVRRGARDLEIIKASPGYDIDLLARAHVISRAKAGIVAIEGGLGLAPAYRHAIESGELKLEEHSCMTIATGYRAAAAGVPFEPVAGVFGSDLLELNNWKILEDPYGSGKRTVLVPAIAPDVAVIHANEVDAQGNARVYGSPHWDHPLTRAAKRVFVTAEKLVSTEHLAQQPELTLVPGFMVEAVAIVPHGAWPGSLHPDYDVDYDAVRAYLEAGDDALARHLATAPEASPEAISIA
jgi:glutaconate CoA-transferase subunit A